MSLVYTPVSFNHNTATGGEALCYLHLPVFHYTQFYRYLSGNTIFFQINKLLVISLDNTKKWYRDGVVYDSFDDICPEKHSG